MSGEGYSAVEGRATITAHRLPDPLAYNEPDPIEVCFSFEPDDPTAVGRYRFPEVEDHDQRLTVGGGANPSRQWVVDKGLTVGSTLRCVRRELVTGVGPPVLFVFPALPGASDGDDL
jgi:hypothetical protein